MSSEECFFKMGNIGTTRNNISFRFVGPVALAICLVAVVALTGCSQSSAAEQKVEEAPEVVEAGEATATVEDLTIIGEKTDRSLEMRVDNKIGKPIETVIIKLSTDVDFATPVFSSDVAIGPFERVLMYFEPSDVDPSAAAV
ncbi:MAG TPA: hypothetical protein DEB24_04455, partial [Coriobacteriia bacterium]|nr:hypothetical protein [Coriobacteriia bacterium]